MTCHAPGTDALPMLGLDVGTRRIGIALSNTLGIAQPLLTLERTQPRRDQRSVLRLARRYGCNGIVVGNPLRMSGDPSRQTGKVHQFVSELRELIAAGAGALDTASQPPSLPNQALPNQARSGLGTGVVALPVHLWDERLSTVEAHATLDATCRDARQQRRLVDQVAAAIILQGWLDAQLGVVTLLPSDLPGPPVV